MLGLSASLPSLKVSGASAAFLAVLRSWRGRPERLPREFAPSKDAIGDHRQRVSGPLPLIRDNAQARAWFAGGRTAAHAGRYL